MKVILIAIVAESDSDGDRTHDIKEVKSVHRTFSRSHPYK